MRGGYLTLFAGGDFNFAGIGSATLLAEFDARQVFSDTALTTPQSTDGGAVGGWKDIANNTHHLIQATGANQPLYKVNIFGGRPAVRGNGSSNFLQNTTTALASHINGDDRPFAIYMAVKMITPASSATLVSWGHGSSATRYMQGNTGSLNKIRLAEVDDAAVSGATSQVDLDTAAHIVSLRFDGTTRRCQVDSGTATTNTTALGVMTINRFTLFALGRNTNTQFTNVDIGRVLVYATDVSAADHAVILSALKAEYGTP